jgi:hypothetical protein
MDPLGPVQTPGYVFLGEGYMTQGRMGGGTGFLSSRDGWVQSSCVGERYAQATWLRLKGRKREDHW